MALDDLLVKLKTWETPPTVVMMTSRRCKVNSWVESREREVDGKSSERTEQTVMNWIDFSRHVKSFVFHYSICQCHIIYRETCTLSNPILPHHFIDNIYFWELYTVFFGQDETIFDLLISNFASNWLVHREKIATCVDIILLLVTYTRFVCYQRIRRLFNLTFSSTNGKGRNKIGSQNKFTFYLFKIQANWRIYKNFI